MSGDDDAVHLEHPEQEDAARRALRARPRELGRVLQAADLRDERDGHDEHRNRDQRSAPTPDAGQEERAAGRAPSRAPRCSARSPTASPKRQVASAFQPCVTTAEAMKKAATHCSRLLHGARRRSGRRLIDDQRLVPRPDEHERPIPSPAARNAAIDGRRIARDSKTAQPAKAAAKSASLASPWKRMP